MTCHSEGGTDVKHFTVYHRSTIINFHYFAGSTDSTNTLFQLSSKCDPTLTQTTFLIIVTIRSKLPHLSPTLVFTRFLLLPLIVLDNSVHYSLGKVSWGSCTASLRHRWGWKGPPEDPEEYRGS